VLINKRLKRIYWQLNERTRDPVSVLAGGLIERIDLDSSSCCIYTWSDIRQVVGTTFDGENAPLPEESCVVTKKEIVKTISEEIGLTQLKTKEIVQKTFDAIVETLVEEGRIELRNFGVFEVKKRAARKARNPRTGQRVDVPEKYVVTFKPGKEMEERVKQLEREAEAMRQPAREAEEETSAPGAGSSSAASAPPSHAHDAHASQSPPPDTMQPAPGFGSRGSA
jgi:nucleoid DNA-binding protein